MILSKTIIVALLILGVFWIMNTAMAQKVPVDMAPAMAEPAGKPVSCKPFCEVDKDTFTLSNGTLCCKFSTTNKQLRLLSLYNEFMPGEMLIKSAKSALFVVEANGKRYIGSQDFELKSIARQENGFVAILDNTELEMSVSLQASIDSEGLRLSSQFTNSGTKTLAFKVAFPAISGLKLSDKIADDYYYFPWGGGVISTRPTNMRLGYGDSQALWQIMDVFSPEKGTGVYLRGDDDKGFHKNMVLRKNITGQPEQSADGFMRNTTKAKFRWLSSPLEQQDGTGLALEYFQRARTPGTSYSPPSAVLAVHSGNWKTAMSAYSSWAHKVWKFTQSSPKLSKVAYIGIAGWPDSPLYVKGGYRNDFLQPYMDAAELSSYWNWSTTAPYGVPLDNMSPAMQKEVNPYVINDPVTGKKMFMGCAPDYSGYNDRFGGLETFKKAIAANKRPDRPVYLYANPLRLGETNKIARAHGEDWKFYWMNDKPTNNGNTINPCHYLPEVQDWMISSITRIVKETGADGVRLDEVGGQYGACFSPTHSKRHVAYEENGLSEWNKVMAESLKKLRAEMDKTDPTNFLMIEHQGYDYLFANVDAVLSYDLSLMDTWDAYGNATEKVRPFEVNMQRFYFPECKVYEINLLGCDPNHKRKFWNGLGSFHHVLPTNIHNILLENQDVFWSKDCEPLIPTLAKRLYANRFSMNDKTIYHVYNASGKKFIGPVLELQLGANVESDLSKMNSGGKHLFDLLQNKELHLKNGILEMSLKNDDVASIAVLPVLLNVTRDGNVLKIKATIEANGQKVAVCDANGGRLQIAEFNPAGNSFDISGNKDAVAVKLLSKEGMLLDIAEIK